MAVAVGSTVNYTPGTSTNTGASPSITTATSNPCILVAIGIFADGVSVSSLTITGFGGTAALVKTITLSGGTDMTLEIWKITAPTANTAGTVQVNFSGSCYFMGSVQGWSGAHQTDPCPAADAVTDISATDPRTVTPGNLTANDASFVAGQNRAGGQDFDTPSPNSLYLDNAGAGDNAFATGYNTGTSGVTFGVTATGTYITNGVRVVAATGTDLSVSFGTIGEPVVGGSTF